MVMANTPMPLASIEEIIEEARAGRMYILVDDEDRENEGDLIIPGVDSTTETVNFMATHGRGLICLALDHEQVKKLELPPMAVHNAARHTTAFTVSIEAREGITTGISAADRALTIATAINPQCRTAEIVSPGHVFPLEAREGGVLVRAGHTEASVDISRLAGKLPSAVICEIMNEDGTMARLPDLIPYAQKHGIKIGQIKDLIAYRRRTEQLVTLRAKTKLTSHFGGEWQVHVYADSHSSEEHVALVMGDIPGKEPPLVRMHALNVLDDILGDTARGHHEILSQSMAQIAQVGRGVVVLVRNPSPTSWSTSVAEHATGDTKIKLKDYGIGAQILRDLGIRDMILLSNTHKTIIGLDGYNLHVVEERAIQGAC